MCFPDLGNMWDKTETECEEYCSITLENCAGFTVYDELKEKKCEFFSIDLFGT